MKFRTLFIAALAALVSGLLVAQAQVPGVNSTLNSVFTLAYDNSTMKPTYSATSVIAPTSTIADACALSGSATKTLKVRRVIVGGNTTVVETLPVVIQKYSTLYTAGGGVRPTIIPYDSANAAATGVVETWVASPTAGTAVGMLADVYVGFPNQTTGTNNSAYTFEFGRLGQPIVLRGVAQYVSVNMSGQNLASGNLSCTFEWTEET